MPTRRMPDRRLFWVAGILAAAADHLTKWAIYEKWLGSVESRTVEIIPGFFYLITAENTGVVWGLFRHHPGLVVVAGFVAASVVVFFFHKYGGSSKLEALAWGVILGGAVGNLADRALSGHVRDFLDFKIASWSWPTFNVADACISLGAVVLVLRYIIAPAAAGEGEEEANESPKKAPQ